jgi:hypothetical protein
MWPTGRTSTNNRPDGVPLRPYVRTSVMSDRQRFSLRIPQALRPSRSIPVTPWRSQSRWKARPSTLAVLVVGLWLFGTGEALLVVAEMGNGPWTVLAEGVSSRTSLSIGLATFLLSLVVLALWIPLRERPGLGTIANAVVIAAALQVGVWFLPHPDPTWLKLVFVFAGVALIGLGSGLVPHHQPRSRTTRWLDDRHPPQVRHSGGASAVGHRSHRAGTRLATRWHGWSGNGDLRAVDRTQRGLGFTPDGSRRCGAVGF